MPVMTIELDDEDVKRLKALVQNAMAEVDASAQPDAVIQPDDSFSLMTAYDWGRQFLTRLTVLRDAGPDDPHGVAMVKCRLCNYRCVSVFPKGTDTDRLECANCHHMTMEPEA